MVERKDDGGAAFPFVAWKSPDGMVTMGGGQPGMSLRDWFATHALNACLDYHGPHEAGEAAKQAYRIADAMLAARSAPISEETR